MDRATKIIIGVALTSLMAWGAHSALGTGPAFIDRLESNASSALKDQSLTGVNLEMVREPTLKRTIILSGDESQKEAALTLVKGVPGVGLVKWASDENGADGAGSNAASEEAVAECQGNVNELMSGKVINFRSGSAYLAPESNSLIGELASALKPCAGTQVEVQGHTDLTGSADVNGTLSQARADAVKAALIEGGVPGERLTAKGYGSSQPIENARTSAANAKNRRTVFVVSSAGGNAPNNTEEGEE